MYRVIFLTLIVLCLTGNVNADNSRFYGRYDFTEQDERSALCSEKSSTERFILTIGNDSNKIQEGYLYLPLNELSSSFSWVDDDDETINDTLSVSGDVITWSGYESDGDSGKITITFSSDFNTIYWKGAVYEAEEPDCEITVTGSGTRLQNVCTIAINSFTVSGTQEVDSQVTFTVNAKNICSETIQYRFSCHPDYGGVGYDGTSWTQMGKSEYQTENSCTYTFDEAGKYIVVAWLKNSTNDSNDGVMMIGTAIQIHEFGEEPYFPF